MLSGCRFGDYVVSLATTVMGSARRVAAAAGAVVAVLVGSVAVAAPVAGQPGGFGDVPVDAGYSVSVSALAELGVFAGTECAGGFCPDADIDRKTVAVWIVRLVDGRDPPVVAQSRFDDVDAAGFYAPFIERMVELGVSSGCGDRSGFCPDSRVSRAHMAAFVSKAYELPNAADPGFSDVAADVWWAVHVARLAGSGITAGCGDGLFCPERSTTRAETAAFLHRAEEYKLPPQERFAAASAGYHHSCSVRTEGRIVCWGANDFGQASAPEGEFAAVSAGGWHSCGVRTEGRIVCWGGDWSGQASAPEGEFAAVSAGDWHSCGVRTDGTIVCWGDDGSGRASAPEGEFAAVSAGGWHSCGVRTDGTIVCWGDDGSGRASAPEGEFAAVSAGVWHSCGVRTDGTIVCWGFDGSGQASAPEGEFAAVSAGGWHSCGVRTEGRIVCWGGDWSGQASAPEGEFAAVSAGRWHSCGVRTDGRTVCWGSNDFGRASAPEGEFAAVSAGRWHFCGVRTDGTIVCWGSNDFGQASAPEGEFAAVSAGDWHSCGVRTDGTIVCWGDDGSGRASAPEGEFAAVSAGGTHSCGVRTDGTIVCWGGDGSGQASAPEGEFAAVSAGVWHSCGVRTDGTIVCWGDDGSGQASAPEGEFAAVSAGFWHSCGVRTDGTIVCWGANDFGQASAPEGEFAAVSAGRWHSCGLLIDGAVVCWGNNDRMADAPSGPFSAVTADHVHSCGLRADGAVACWGFAPDVAAPNGVFDFLPADHPDPSRCRPHGVRHGTTAGFPRPSFASPAAGRLEVAVVFVDFPDAEAAHTTHQEAESSLPHTEVRLESASFGRLDVEFAPLHQWLRAPQSHDNYVEYVNIGDVIGQLIDEDAARLADDHFDFTGYHVIMIVMPSSHFGGGTALGRVNTQEGQVETTRVNTNPREPSQPHDWGRTAAHELMHNLGLADLYSYNRAAADSDERPEAPAGKMWTTHSFGLMGLNVSALVDLADGQSWGAGEMLAWSRWQLGWLAAPQILCITAPEATVSLSPVADPGDGAAMAAVPLSGTEVIVVESRRKIGLDADVDTAGNPRRGLWSEGVLVYTVDASIGSGHLPVKLAADTGNGQIGGSPLLTEGQSVTVRGYTITVVSDDGDTHTVTVTTAPD